MIRNQFEGVVTENIVRNAPVNEEKLSSYPLTNVVRFRYGNRFIDMIENSTRSSRKKRAKLFIIGSTEKSVLKSCLICLDYQRMSSRKQTWRATLRPEITLTVWLDPLLS